MLAEGIPRPPAGVFAEVEGGELGGLTEQRTELPGRAVSVNRYRTQRVIPSNIIGMNRDIPKSVPGKQYPVALRPRT